MVVQTYHVMEFTQGYYAYTLKVIYTYRERKHLGIKCNSSHHKQCWTPFKCNQFSFEWRSANGLALFGPATLVYRFSLPRTIEKRTVCHIKYPHNVVVLCFYGCWRWKTFCIILQCHRLRAPESAWESNFPFPALSFNGLVYHFYPWIVRVYGILVRHMILNVYIWYKALYYAVFLRVFIFCQKARYK